MSILDKKGISVTSGFKLVSGQPLDARNVVDTTADLQDLIDKGASYEGMIVWVKSEKKSKQFNGTSWSDISSGGSTGDGNYLEVVEVDELPGTPIHSAIPSGGTYISNVYFDTTLSDSEMETILSQITYELWNEEQGLMDYIVCKDLGDAVDLKILAIPSYNAYAIIYWTKQNPNMTPIWTNQTAYQLFKDIYGLPYAGWYITGNTPIFLDITNTQSLEKTTYNELLKEIMYVDGGLYATGDINKLYKTPDNKYYRNIDNTYIEVLNKLDEIVYIDLPFVFGGAFDNYRISDSDYELFKQGRAKLRVSITGGETGAAYVDLYRIRLYIGEYNVRWEELFGINYDYSAYRIKFFYVKLQDKIVVEYRSHTITYE